ncbi:NlpC/P60 family protein [Streptomyces sp. NPDC002589]|uniref:C40 family peptidase n=1 Tax=Streptomyces sp. NPDC002589 TaxID=3154420 RepID=UPI00332D6216
MAPESRDAGAQRDEVRQRIESLYDRAEYATGNYNATRAMASVSRSRGVPPAGRPGRRPDPALDEVTRQWFDAARAKLGPTVPAVLPADRLPDRPAAPRRSRERRGGGLPDGTRGALGPGQSARRPEALERAVDRVVAELTAGRATDPESLALAARESGRLALPGPRRLELPSAERDVTDSLLEPAETAVLPVVPAPAETTALPVPALSAAQSAPLRESRTPPGATAPSRPSPATSKANNQRKLAAASDLISRHAAQLVTYAATVQPAPVMAAPPAPDAAAVPLMPDTAVSPALGTAVPPTPVTAVPPTNTQLPSDSPTGQWEQPQWAGPAGTVTAAPTATDTWSDPLASATLGSAPISSVTFDSAPVTSMPDTAAMTSVTDTGPMTAVTDTGSLAAVTGSPEAVRVAKAVAFARAQIGKPCVWGATGPDSYDCSSLTQAAWKAAGVTLPRAAHQQALAGAPVTLAGIEPGDLVLFFDDDRHVGLHVGGGMMVHAPGPGSSIREESIYGAGEAAIHRIVRPA